MKALGVLVTLAAIILGLALQVSAGPPASAELDQREEDQNFTILLPHQDFSIVLPAQGQE
jgi:hypothetical protein